VGALEGWDMGRVRGGIWEEVSPLQRERVWEGGMPLTRKF